MTTKKCDRKDRGFHWSSKAWYWNKSIEDQIMIGIYPGDGNEGTYGEMAIIWVNISGSKLSPQLKCFDDGFYVLSTFTDLIQELGKVDNKSISQEKFVEILKSCGFRDLTHYKYEDSYPNRV